VDAANDGDVIKVATGVYTGISTRAGVTQVVYISKTVTVQGGYTTTNSFADPPDPDTNFTTLNAQGQARVLYVTGALAPGAGISPTIEGLRITGGDSAGLGREDGVTDVLDSPTHTYMTAGTYTVTPTASGLGGTDTLARSHYININQKSPASATIVKSVTPTDQVEYGDEITYTLVVSAAPGTQLGLYDPLTGTTFLRFVEPVEGITHTQNAVVGTLMVTPTNQIKVSFVTRVDVPGTVGWMATVTNRACVYPFGGTLSGCIWSNEVANNAFRFIFLPLVLRNS